MNEDVKVRGAMNLYLRINLNLRIKKKKAIP